MPKFEKKNTLSWLYLIEWYFVEYYYHNSSRKMEELLSVPCMFGIVDAMSVM